LDSANHFQEANKNTGTLVDMAAIATWVVQATARRKVAVQLRHDSTVE
jgi:hypothetical protein